MALGAIPDADPEDEQNPCQCQGRHGDVGTGRRALGPQGEPCQERPDAKAYRGREQRGRQDEHGVESGRVSIGGRFLDKGIPLGPDVSEMAEPVPKTGLQSQSDPVQAIQDIIRSFGDHAQGQPSSCRLGLSP